MDSTFAPLPGLMRKSPQNRSTLVFVRSGKQPWKSVIGFGVISVVVPLMTGSRWRLLVGGPTGLGIPRVEA